MNLRQLEILRAVIRHHTTVAAAEELALSQPAISNALKAMEAQAGFTLFERVNNRLFPTPEAMTLYEESEAIFALHARLENRVRDLREQKTGHLSIVATPPLAYSIIPPTLSGFLGAGRRRGCFSTSGVMKALSKACSAVSPSWASRSACPIIPALPMRWCTPARWSA